jgi:hypothetical protein
MWRAAMRMKEWEKHLTEFFNTRFSFVDSETLIYFGYFFFSLTGRNFCHQRAGKNWNLVMKMGMIYILRRWHCCGSLTFWCWSGSVFLFDADTALCHVAAFQDRQFSYSGKVSYKSSRNLLLSSLISNFYFTAKKSGPVWYPLCLCQHILNVSFLIQCPNV